MAQRQSIAIIGAGITGLHLARQMAPVADVTIFEKSRGLGGRMSTRRTQMHQFDHGAQYFTAHGEGFRRFLAPYIADGVVAPWTPRLVEVTDTQVSALQWNTPRYVSLPGMSSLAKAMADGLQIVGNTRIKNLARHAGKWHLTSEKGDEVGTFDWVVSTAPQPQTKALLPASFAQHVSLDQARMQGCYSLMLGFAERPDLPWDAAIVKNSPLAWIAVNGSKPERSGSGSILCQSANDWAEDHMEDDQETVQAQLCEVFQNVTGINTADAAYVSLHRWRYAKVIRPVGESFLMDETHNLAAAGDWCGAGRVEAGFDSAAALADRLHALLQASCHA